ncbi:MAG: methylated-DNA--[protein]-cysteine S-methyltransferase, partial [Candidatus Dormibacteraeota bacterium]|nr:methylated-DNA--[protein]-cysteine S-methyltransferase [Candidatus Dormibacteraeota bacterium]
MTTLTLPVLESATASPELLRPRPVPTRFTFVPSPIGELLVTGDGEAITGLLFPPHRDRSGGPKGWVRDDALFGEARRQLDAYFAGDLRAFDLPLAPAGSPFQRDVWQALLTVPYGSTRTYGAIARQVGRPDRARAVGAANGRNPIAIVLPCHRIIGAGGDLVGYGGGLRRKAWLLSLERTGRPP